MNEFYAIVFYRCLIAAIGGLTIYLGYRLFFVVLERQGEISVRTGRQYEVRMRDVAPGTFFALFGAIVLTVSIFNPMKQVDTVRTPSATSLTSGSGATMMDQSASGGAGGRPASAPTAGGIPASAKISASGGATSGSTDIPMTPAPTSAPSPEKSGEQKESAEATIPISPIRSFSGGTER